MTPSHLGRSNSFKLKQVEWKHFIKLVNPHSFLFLFFFFIYPSFSKDHPSIRSYLPIFLSSSTGSTFDLIECKLRSGPPVSVFNVFTFQSFLKWNAQHSFSSFPSIAVAVHFSFWYPFETMARSTIAQKQKLSRSLSSLYLIIRLYSLHLSLLLTSYYFFCVIFSFFIERINKQKKPSATY